MHNHKDPLGRWLARALISAALLLLVTIVARAVTYRMQKKRKIVSIEVTTTDNLVKTLQSDPVLRTYLNLPPTVGTVIQYRARVTNYASNAIGKYSFTVSVDKRMQILDAPQITHEPPKQFGPMTPTKNERESDSHNLTVDFETSRSDFVVTCTFSAISGKDIIPDDPRVMGSQEGGVETLVHEETARRAVGLWDYVLRISLWVFGLCLTAALVLWGSQRVTARTRSRAELAIDALQADVQKQADQVVAATSDSIRVSDAVRVQIEDLAQKIPLLETADRVPSTSMLLSQALRSQEDGNLERAAQLYQQVVQRNPRSHQALNNWGNALADLAKTKKGEEVERLFREAIEKLRRALEIKPDKHVALYNWGNALADLAKTKEGEEAEPLFREAIGKFERALEMKPDTYKALNNWGTTLLCLGDAKEGEEAERLFREAIGKFERALEIKPDDPEVLSNWGAALTDLGDAKEGEEAERLFREAIGKFERALEVKPDAPEVLSNWGTTLLHLGDAEEGEEAERLFREAIGKFERAAESKPDDHGVLNNWGSALADLAKTKEGEEAERLFDEAAERFQLVLNVEPDDVKVLYNRACLQALRSNREAMLADLKRAIDLDEKLRGRATQDSDFSRYRDDPDFQAIVGVKQ